MYESRSARILRAVTERPGQRIAWSPDGGWADTSPDGDRPVPASLTGTRIA